MWVLETILQLVDAIAVALVLSFVFGMILRGVPEGRGRKLLTGFLFGLGGILVMVSPVTLPNSVFIDIRSIMIVLAGAFAGWEAGILSLVMISAARLGMGLPEANGFVIWVSITYGFLAELAGALIWGKWLRRRFKRAVWQAASLVVIVTGFVLVAMNWAVATSIPGLLSVLAINYGVFMVGVFLAAIVMLREETLAERAARLTSWAMSDPLTGVLNRRGLKLESEKSIGGQPFAVICVDLDEFKEVNDALGHGTGDAALCDVAHGLEARLPDGAILARVGGDEFVIVLPDVDAQDATQMAEQLSQVVGEITVAGQDKAKGLSASIGVHWSQGGVPLAVVMHMADKALYRSKAKGSGHVVVSREAPPEDAVQTEHGAQDHDVGAGLVKS